MSQNGIVTVIILSFVSIWNEYAYAMVLLSNNKFHTLPHALSFRKGEFFVDYGLQCAAVHGGGGTHHRGVYLLTEKNCGRNGGRGRERVKEQQPGSGNMA